MLRLLLLLLLMFFFYRSCAWSRVAYVTLRYCMQRATHTETHLNDQIYHLRQ